MIEEDTNEPPRRQRFRLRDQKVSGCGFPPACVGVSFCCCFSVWFGGEFVKEEENELL